MKNYKQEYLVKLLERYHSKKAGGFINSKIRANGNSLFCYKCSRSFVLKVNCTGKLTEEELRIKCEGCKTESRIARRHVER